MIIRLDRSTWRVAYLWRCGICGAIVGTHLINGSVSGDPHLPDVLQDAFPVGRGQGHGTAERFTWTERGFNRFGVGISILWGRKFRCCVWRCWRCWERHVVRHTRGRTLIVHLHLLDCSDRSGWVLSTRYSGHNCFDWLPWSSHYRISRLNLSAKETYKKLLHSFNYFIITHLILSGYNSYLNINGKTKLYCFSK